jgi:hypothetical protein
MDPAPPAQASDAGAANGVSEEPPLGWQIEGQEKQEEEEQEEHEQFVVNVLPRFACPDKAHMDLDEGDLVCRECGQRLLELCPDCQVYTPSSGSYRAAHYRSAAHVAAADDDEQDGQEEQEEEEQRPVEKERVVRGGDEVWGMLRGVHSKRQDVKCQASAAHERLDFRSRKCLECGSSVYVRCCGKWLHQ